MVDPKVVPLHGVSGAEGLSRSSGADPLAAGAARASGERAKRRRTPLLTDRTGDELATPQDPDAIDAFIAPVVHRPRPAPKSGPFLTARAARTAANGRQREPRSTRRSAFAALTGSSTPVTSPPPEGTSARTAIPASAQQAPTQVESGVDDLVTFAIATLRKAAEISGLSGDDIERQVAGTLAFVRRRLSGDYTVDEFGFDQDFTENAYLPLLRPLYKSWFRVDVRGIENIPSSGGALIVANHSGTIALDSLMTQVAVHDEHPAHRHLRMLGADLLFKTPVVGEVARKSGCTLAANPDAERLLACGELAGVWPEGYKGVGKPFSERYKLQRFGRGGFVAAALRTSVPIVPCSIVGAEEIYPILGNLKTVARLIGAPYVPITPTFPLMGPLGLVPLPSKWIIEFGSPVDTAVLGPQAADDPMVVFDLTDRVRETIQQTLYSLLLQRRSVFF
jgi:1-acyl-sn-glycerol-3-phosphate acyltransferase